MTPGTTCNPIGFLKKIFNKEHWSLKTRLVYMTGLLLLACTLVLLFTFSYTLNTKTEQSIATKLYDFETLIAQTSHKFSNRLIETAGYLSIYPEVQKALEKQQPNILVNNFIPSLAALKHLTGHTSPILHFYLPDMTSFYHSDCHIINQEKDQHELPMVKKVKETLLPVSGIQKIKNELFLAATIPVFVDKVNLGFITTSLPLNTLLNYCDKLVENSFGVVVTTLPITSKNKKTVIPPVVATSWGQTRSIQTTDALAKIPDYMSSKVLPLRDYQQKHVADAHIFFDNRELQRSTSDTILLLSCITIISIVAVFCTLIWNVSHIETFLKQIKKALISSHANEFNDRFELDSVHCLELLNCGHKECPVHQDPTKVCYLETGDEAISPTWRSTCIFLNKFTTCSNCPVYQARHGNELTEIKHVMNTTMGLWSGFLNNVSTLLSDVFRTNLSEKPGLDDISNYLKQMAQLTTFSHDIQGSIDKEEVYSQLKHIFQQRFNLHKFNLLEINASENRMSSVITNQDITSSHTEIFFNCDLCRARRNAEIVTSATPPHLCRHFGLHNNSEVRCCLPMVMGGRVGAVFTFVVDRTIWPEKQKELAILQKYLEETAPILSSLRLLKITKEQALKDPLTLCHNRRFMDEYLVHLNQLNERNPRQLGFIMADFDHFKKVNDEHGHHAGDSVLKQLAEIIRNTIRNSDLLIRYGGEEFLIILQELEDIKSTAQVAEKIRVAVENSSIILPAGGHLKKTISLGVAEFPTDASEFYKTIKFADVALYQAKEQGRNRVVSFKKSMWTDEEY